MEINDVIEEVDEDKNNITKSRNSNNKEENNSQIKSRNINIKKIKDATYEEKELKKGLNKYNQMYKSLALSKEKNRKKINIISNEKLSFTFKNISNKIINTPDEKNYQNNYDISKINLPLLNNLSIISSKQNLPKNYHNETPSTSAYTNSTKNTIRNSHNSTEKISKFRLGLYSANTSSNNTIIPFLPIERPVSNFNFGGNQLWETDATNKINNQENKNVNKIENVTNKNKFLRNNKNKFIYIRLDNKNKYKSISSEHSDNNMNNIFNLKSKIHLFGKDKENESRFNNNKLNEFKMMANYINKNNSTFYKKNCNKSLSVKK